MSSPLPLSPDATATGSPPIAPILPGFVRVYHFLPSEFALSDIALRRMKVSRLADLNDPFELLAANLGQKRTRQAVRGLKQQLHEKRGLLSFSRQWASPVLWSHYAAKHHGMCLGFDLQSDLAIPVAYEPNRILSKIDNIDARYPVVPPEFVEAL